jgi:hypothetical protein
VGLFVDEPAHNNQTLTEHWDGTGWTIVSSPSPGVEDAVLLDAAASPDGSVWAVGGFKAPPEQTLVLRTRRADSLSISGSGGPALRGSVARAVWDPPLLTCGNSIAGPLSREVREFREHPAS